MRASNPGATVPASVRRSIMLLVLAVAGSATAGASTLARDEGYLALPIQSDRDIPKFEFVGRVDHKFTIRSFRAGRHLVLVEAKAGTYDLMKLNLGSNWYIDIARTRDSPATVEIVAGAISYAGDLELDARGSSTRFTFGGCSIDTIRTLAALDPDIDVGVFDSYQVVDRSEHCRALRGDGPDSRKISEWESAAGRRPAEAELATLNRILARHGKPPLALGQKASDAWNALDELPQDRLRRFRDLDEPTVLWVRLEGLWGWRGHGTSFLLPISRGVIAGAMLRQFVYDGYYSNPEPDLRRDVEDYSDGR